MEGLSSSELRALYFKSPYHYKYLKEHPEHDEYKKFYEQGTLIHTMILEPQRVEDSLYVMNAEYKDFRTKAAREERDEALQQNKNVLLYDDYLEVKTIVECYKQNPLIQTYLTEGEAELSIFWDDPETGLKCKCRPDYLTAQYLIDVKSCGDLDKFEQTVRNYNYHVQAAHYLNGTGLDNFFILALSKQPPYDVELFVLDEDYIRRGKEICRGAIDTLSHCINTDNWPNRYGVELKVLQYNTKKEVNANG